MWVLLYLKKKSAGGKTWMVGVCGISELKNYN